jgi:hypothetical protein
MSRLVVAFVFVAACVPATPTAVGELEPEALTAAATPSAVTRERVAGDIYHYQLDVRVGSTPNARVRVHRVVREDAPWRPRHTGHAVMLLHGDFANFVTNFLPTLGDPASPATGLARYLVTHDIDVWGTDRRWTLPASDGDTSDFGAMGVDQELGDIGVALAFARATRAVTDGDPGRIVLGGFSHGGQLTYAYAAADGRHVSGIAVLDVYYDIAPADAALQQFACDNAAFEADAVAQGVVDSDNSFFIGLGALDRSAPTDPSPLFPPYTNRGALFTLAGVTGRFVPYTPQYHLIAPVLDAGGEVAAIRYTSEAALSAWFAAAPPHQSMREAAELDAIWCHGSLRPELANIHVPLIYIGAAGAFGDYGLYSTTRVSSADVTTLVVQRLADDRVAEDFGHGDLLYAADAAKLAWKPLAAWLSRH